MVLFGFGAVKAGGRASALRFGEGWSRWDFPAKAGIRPSVGEEVPLPSLLKSGQKIATLDSDFRRGDVSSYILSLKNNDRLTSKIMVGTSMRGPMTAAKAWLEPTPKTATATAMASSKLLLAEVKDKVAVFS